MNSAFFEDPQTATQHHQLAVNKATGVAIFFEADAPQRCQFPNPKQPLPHRKVPAHTEKEMLTVLVIIAVQFVALSLFLSIVLLYLNWPPFQRAMMNPELLRPSKPESILQMYFQPFEEPEYTKVVNTGVGGSAKYDHSQLRRTQSLEHLAYAKALTLLDRSEKLIEQIRHTM